MEENAPQLLDKRINQANMREFLEENPDLKPEGLEIEEEVTISVREESMNEHFVPIDNVAKHFSVSVSTVRAWVRQGHIPEDTYVKIGNTYRFRVGDVLTALMKVSSKRSEETVSEDSLAELDEDI